MIGISWGDPALKGGAIELWDGGIIVATECCGCVSETLADRQQILSIYHALGDWLIAHPRDEGIQ